MQRRRELRLDADHPGAGPEPFTAVAIPADQAAAADRNDHHVHVGNVLEQLEADRSLARDRQRVVERMHERSAGLLDQLREPVEGLGRAGRLEVDLGAVAARGLDLRLARALPHDDQRVEPLRGRTPGERLRVVAGRDADHAARALSSA